jgi:precorrin-4 methylase
LVEPKRKGNKTMNDLKKIIRDFNNLCVKQNMESLKVFSNDGKTIGKFLIVMELENFLEAFSNNEYYNKEKPYFVLSYDTYAQSKTEEEILEYINERVERFDFLDFIK